MAVPLLQTRLFTRRAATAGLSHAPDRAAERGRLRKLIPSPPRPVLARPHNTALINEIATLPDHIALVLGDCHLIMAPPLPLAGTRGQGQLTELRQSVLLFITVEAAAFLNTRANQDLSPNDVAALRARTEGWIADLQMTAVPKRGQDDG